MKIQSWSVFLFLFLAAAISSCSGSSSDNVNPTLKVLASNVMLSSANASINKSEDVDTTTKVLASNVELNTDNNKLTSTNLQNALDNEMAVKLSTVLIGTWTIANKTKDPYYDGLTGQITVADDGTFSMDSGVFAAAGISESCKPITNSSYEILGNNSIIYISFTDQGAYTRDSVMSVISATSNQVALVGDGGCGWAGVTRASVLTKVE